VNIHWQAPGLRWMAGSAGARAPVNFHWRAGQMATTSWPHQAAHGAQLPAAIRPGFHQVYNKFAKQRIIHLPG
jgi:hypothetical protein